MKLVLTPRRFGKTSLMVSWLRGDKNRVLMVHAQHERSRILNLYFKEEEYEQYAPRILIPGENLHGQESRSMAVDNIDLVLESYIRQSIEVGTMSTDEAM